MSSVSISAQAVSINVCEDGEASASHPFVILATGQSNIQLHPSYEWTPPPNLKLWNWDGGSDPTAVMVGTAFANMPGSSMGASYSYAAQVACDNPHRSVYLVNVGISALPIAKWKAGATAPDMYAACKTNVEAALSAIGASKIDEMFWWQGETDAINGNDNYVGDFEAVIARFRGETWFPLNTPVLIMGVSQFVSFSPKVKFFDHVLRQVASRDPGNRVFVDTQSLPVSYWISPELIHMTAEGYRLAGEMAYRAARRGGASGWQLIAKKYNDIRPNTSVLADDPELGLYVFPGKTYRIRGSIVGSTSPTADFRYGFRGPNGTVIQTYHHTMNDGLPNTETVAMSASGSLPSGQIVQIASAGNFRIVLDAVIYNPSSAGQVRFQWCQNTADAANTVVMAGSYLEYMEV